MLTSTSMRWLVVAVSAAMLLAVVAACSSETIEVPGETVVVEKVVTETVEVPGETVVVEKEVIRTVEVPGETVTKEVVKEVMVPGETVVVEKEVVKTVEVPGETVTVEVVKEVQVPGETVVVEKEVVKTVEVPGQTVVVEKVVVQEVPGKKYVTDPTTGKVVSAPEYGGTLTIGYKNMHNNWDSYSGWVDAPVMGVVEKLGILNWGIDRDVFDFPATLTWPRFVITGRLAESWETPDDTTFIFHIRDGVRWHDKAPMNGRLLTAQDIEFNFHRMVGLGEFAAAGPSAFGGASNLLAVPFESVTATDDSTVVMKLTKPYLPAFKLITQDLMVWIMPPEVIKEHGGIADWRNLVGTGPFELTDWREGSSSTRTRNPDYWGHDEKYPENRLPYVDEVRYLIIPEEATLQAALLSGKIDLRGPDGATINSIDTVDSLQKTNPEIVLHSHFLSSMNAFAANVRVPPFDDVRVRKAMQMALDLETIVNTFFKGYAIATPQGMVGVPGFYIPFEEWPEEVKKGYRYDPEGAEKLLDEAGYRRGADGTRFKTSARIWGSASYAEIAAAYWAEIGVDVEVNAYSDFALMFAPLFARSYEGMMSGTAGSGFAPAVLLGWHRSGNTWERSLHQWPELDALVDAALAAITFEEQQRRVRETDMYAIENHWQIWGPKSPTSWAVQPWVIGYNGEFCLGPNEASLIVSRLWIDSELKEAMGH